MSKKDKEKNQERDFSVNRETWEIWADYADGIDTVLAHQNASLMTVAAHRDALLGMIAHWARRRLLNGPGAFSAEERALFDSVKLALTK